MKKTLKVLLVLVAVLGVFSLTGCGKKKGEDLSKYAGTYEGEYGKFVGDTDDARQYEEFSLELNADGTGVHHRDSLDITVKWSIDGEKVTMSESSIIEYTGTLKDGKLVLYNGEETDPFTYQYVYNKK